MSDLIPKLREGAEWYKSSVVAEIANEAADSIVQLEAKIKKLEIECNWWHERAWEIASEYVFHDGGSILRRDTWEAAQAAIKEASDE